MCWRLRLCACARSVVEVERPGPGRWRVFGRGVGGLTEPEDVLDMGNFGNCGASPARPAGDAPADRRQ